MSTLPVPPYDELTPGPFSIYEPVDLTKTLYPEKSTQGLGRQALRRKSQPVVGDQDEDNKDDKDQFYFVFAIARWPGLLMGDYLGLRIGDLTKPTVSTNILFDAPRYFLFAKASSVGEGDLEYFGRVVRVGSLQESRSATQQMLFKTTIPAGEDRRPLEHWHSGLIMWLRDLKEGALITPDVIAGGVWCVVAPYLNMRQNDKITFVVDGNRFIYVVSPADVASKKPIEVLVPKNVWQQITEFGPFKCYCTVEDVVGNVPEGKWPFSKPISLSSELDSSLLPFPLVLANGEVIDLLDLDTHSTAKIEVEVSLAFNRPTPNPPHKVTLIVETTDQSGVTKIVRLPAINDRNRRSEIIPINNALVTALAGGFCRFWFELSSAGGVLLGTSSSMLVNVVGTPTLMPPIKLIPYEAGQIPANIDVHGTIPFYSPHDPNLLETVIFERIEADGGCERVPFLQLAGPQGGTRLFSKESLKVFENKGRGEVYFETDNGSGKPSAIRRSQVLPFEIGNRIEDLPPMLVPDAISGNFDLSKVKGTEWLMYVTYAATVAGDIVHWSVIGKDAQSSASGSINVTAATAGITLTNLSIPNSTDLLKRNEYGSVRVSYSVERPGTPATFLRSAVLDLTVGAPVVLGLLKIVEADPVNGTIAPSKVTGGATLRISYKSMQAGDQIAYKWRGQYDVSLYESVVAGDPNANSIDVSIPAAVVAKGIRQGGNGVTVSCEVRRGSFVYKFATLNVRLLPLKELPTPRIRGFENTTVLPVDQLAASAFIDIAAWEFFLDDQYYWVTVTGTFADDTPYTEDLAIAKPVMAVGGTKGVSLPFSGDTARKLKEGSVLQISASVSFPGIPSQQTATKFIEATYQIQLLPTTLPYPTLDGASSTGQVTTVDPLAIQNKTSVTVKYPGMVATDKITLKWIRQNGTRYEVTLNGLASGTVVFDLTAAQVLHDSINSRVQLNYSILRGGKTIYSAVQTITVAAITPAKLPQALINGLAPGVTLVYSTLTGDAWLSLDKWVFSKVGQNVWIDVVASGRVLTVLDGYAINAAQAANGLAGLKVMRDWIAAVPDGSKIEVQCRVAFDGGNDNSTALQFPTTTYTADTRLRAPVITRAFTAGAGRDIPFGGAVNTATEGFAIVIYGTCDARPFARTAKLLDPSGNGYDITISAYQTTWKEWAGFHLLGKTSLVFTEQLGGIASNTYWWTKH